MTPIIEGGVKILEKKMDPSNCISTWKLTRSGNLENLKNIAFEYARQNFENVLFFSINLKFPFFNRAYVTSVINDLGFSIDRIFGFELPRYFRVTEIRHCRIMRNSCF